jgi:co-chaperonin GroES (HSP10)
LNYGTVIANCPGLTFTNGALRETVLLPGYSGAKITLSDKQDYYVYRDDDILGILEEPTK